MVNGSPAAFFVQLADLGVVRLYPLLYAGARQVYAVTRNWREGAQSVSQDILERPRRVNAMQG